MHGEDVRNAEDQMEGKIGYGGFGLPALAITNATAHIIDECILSGMALMVVAGMAVAFMGWVSIIMEVGIVMGGGVVFLGLAGTRFTRSFAQGYLRYAVNVGTKLFVFWVVISMANMMMNGNVVNPALAGLHGLWMSDILGNRGQPGSTSATETEGPTTLTYPSGLAAAPNGIIVSILPYTYLAFEFLLMAVVIYTIPAFAGRFVSSTSLLWEGTGVDSVHGSSEMNIIAGGFSSLQTMLRQWKSTEKGSPGHHGVPPSLREESPEMNAVAMAENTILAPTGKPGASDTWSLNHFGPSPQGKGEKSSIATSETFSILPESALGRTSSTGMLDQTVGAKDFAIQRRKPQSQLNEPMIIVPESSTIPAEQADDGITRASGEADMN
jgi:TrbL/VirB6 plasmid conjugal transfer protein